ncbi:hypothetical protein KEM55_003829 [Ascosphaera atra]|nr:hypothetical protein KEM55_007966 [Ascosphaera atra]KAI5309194.1 hypothetical protein KEM55_003829 [Ascosphaera atra]
MVKGLENTRKAAMQLNTINKLRIRSPNQNAANPCLTLMSSMLSCWASQGKTNPGACAAIEEQLRACTDKKRPQNQHTNPVNYHLMRMFPKISGPRKKKGRV